MMALRGVRPTARRQMPARRLVWVRQSFILNPVDQTNGAAKDLLETFRTAAEYGAQPMGTTITRVRGQLLLSEITAVAANDAFTWGLIVEDRSSTLAQLPLPDDQEHVDWLAWQPCAAFGESGRAGSWVRYEIDVKSQRRLDEIGQTLWLVCDARFPGASYNAIFSLSVLLKLP